MDAVHSFRRFVVFAELRIQYKWSIHTHKCKSILLSYNNELHMKHTAKQNARETAQFRILFFRTWERTLISHEASRYHIMSQDSHLSRFFFIINALVFMLSLFVIRTNDQTKRNSPGNGCTMCRKNGDISWDGQTYNFKGFTLSSTLSSLRIVQWRRLSDRVTYIKATRLYKNCC